MEKWFHIKKKRQETDNITQKTITYAEYTYDLLLLINTPAQAKSLPHSLKQTETH